MKRTIKTLIATAGIVLAVSTAANAETINPGADKLCSFVGDLAVTAMKSRDAGESYINGVRDFNHEFNKLKGLSDPKGWMRFYDTVIRDAYASTLPQQTQHDLAYGQCVQALKNMPEAYNKADNPDADLSTDPTASKNDKTL